MQRDWARGVAAFMGAVALAGGVAAADAAATAARPALAQAPLADAVPAARAALALRRCAPGSGVPRRFRGVRLPRAVLERLRDRSLCGRLTVPLDRSGAIPGTVRLFVRTQPPRRGPARETVLALAGGPGQAATPLLDDFARAFPRGWLAPRRLVTFDQRGTGRSGALRCDALLRPATVQRAVAECARELGPRRASYATAASVEDIEAVRRELGVARMVLYGTSYGTKVALEYAAHYPQRVSRLVLDSATLPQSDPFMRPTLASIPRVLRALCAHRACSFTRDPAADFERLVARVRTRPLHGRWIDERGQPHRVVFDGAGLLSLLMDGDVDPLVRPSLPAAVRAALDGDTAPLARLVAPRAADAEGLGVDAALLLATTCSDGPLPWPPGTPIGRREAAIDAAFAALPTGALDPFDARTVWRMTPLDACRAWPESPIAQPTPPLPDVPALILSGDDDLRTPRAEALELAKLLPRARVVTVPGVAHSVLGSARCANQALAAFLTARTIRDCRAPRVRTFPTRPVPPARLRAVRPLPGLPLRVGRALAAVQLTHADVTEQGVRQFVARMGSGAAFTRGVAWGGLRSGNVRFDGRGGARVGRYGFVPGVTLTGYIAPTTRSDTFAVGGAAGIRGTVRIGPRWIAGTLGGRRVRARTVLPDLVRGARSASAGGPTAGAASAALDAVGASLPGSPGVPPAPDRFALSAP